MSTIPMRPLGFGEILDGAIQLYRRDFGLYYLIALVCALPDYILLVLWNPTELLEGMEALEATDDPTAGLEIIGSMFGQLGYIFLVSIVALVFAWFAGLSLTVAMAKRIEERPASLGAAYAGGLRKVISAAGASVLALLIYLVAQAVTVFLSVFLLTGFALVPGSPWLAVVGLIIVLLMNLVLVAFWYGATFAIFPAVVVEGLPAMEALGRSFSLCRGGWLKVVGIMVVAMIVAYAPVAGISALGGYWEMFQTPGEVATISPVRQWVMNTLDLVVGPLTVPFMVGCVMMLFHDRRVRREGYDLETLASEMGAETS